MPSSRITPIIQIAPMRISVNTRFDGISIMKMQQKFERADPLSHLKLNGMHR